MQLKRLIFLLSFALYWFVPHIQLQANSPQIVDSLQKLVNTSEGVQKLEYYQKLISSIRNIDPSQGILLSKKAQKLADSLNNPLLKAQILNEEGVCFRKLNLAEKALQLHLDALKIFEKFNDSLNISFTYSNIGNVYHFLGNYEKALNFHFKSLRIKENLKNEPQIAYSQNAIGMTLSEMGDEFRALEFYLSAMKIHRQHKQVFELANVYSNIGKSLVKLSRYDEALKYMMMALEVYEVNKNPLGISLVSNMLGQVYYVKGDWNKALEKLKIAETIAVQQNNKAALLFNYNLQKTILSKTGRFEVALLLSEQASALKDSLYDTRRFHEISEIQLRFETERLDRENELLKLNLKQQKSKNKVFTVTVISILFIVATIKLTWLLGQRKKEAQKLLRLNQSLEERVNERTKELQEQNEARQKAFKALQRSEERLRAITSTSPFGIAVTNKEGNILSINPRLEEITGIDEAAFLNGTWVQNIIIDDRVLIQQTWFTAHKYESEISETVFRIRQNNDIQWMQLKGARLREEDSFSGMVVVIDNITEYKINEENLVKAKYKAEESDKYKSAFLANMSHEIRTPMNAILGFSDLLTSDEYSKEEKHEFVEMISSSGKMLLNLINDIIDISKIEAGEIKIQHSTFKLAKLTEEIFHTFRQQLENFGKSHIKLICLNINNFTETEITTDKLRLQQILTNLLSNACKFTETGQIEFGFIKVCNKFQFFVKDTGIGIPENKLDIIFERFRQADDAHSRLFGGTGLGLAISKNLVHLLGGEIWVESVEQIGSGFYFTLPDNESDSNPFKVPNFANKIILVAEDVDDNFQLTQKMLSKSGAKVLHAKNGLIAVDMAISIQPDIVLMDIQMPELDGIQALKQLRKYNYRNPIIAVTAFSIGGDEQKFLDLGFDSFLSKPIGNNKLYDLLELFLTSET